MPVENLGLNQKPPLEPLFTLPSKPVVEPTMAADIAQQQVLASGDHSEYRPRKEAAMQGSTVETEALQLLERQVEAGYIKQDLELDILKRPDITPEQRMATISFGLEKANVR